MSCQEPDTFRRSIADYEIDLVDLFLIVWKRKWMIVGLTLLMSMAATGISIFMPNVYEVTAILVPAKDDAGNLVENPLAIRENIVNGAYDLFVAEKLGMSLEKVPEFKVSVPKNTDLVKISVETLKPDKGVNILKTLLLRITENIESQLEVKKSLLKNELEATLLEKQLFPEDRQKLETFIAQTKEKILELEKARKETISDSRGNSVEILLYLNEIKNQQVFLNSLSKEYSDIRNREEMATLKVEQFRLQLASVVGTNISKQPSIPHKPIKPKRTLIVALGFVFGLMVSIMLAFMVEIINKVSLRKKSLGKS